MFGAASGGAKILDTRAPEEKDVEERLFCLLDLVVDYKVDCRHHHCWFGLPAEACSNVIWRESSETVRARDVPHGVIIQ